MASVLKRAALLLAAVGLVTPAFAQAPPNPAAAATSAPIPAATSAETHALTAQDLGGWLDGLMPYALQRSDVPGAVVVVVKDGQPLLERGYGYADVKAKTPVDPATTLFRPGSISKTFTWTAVMQLVQAQKFDLDRDVNAYLDFRIPEAFGKPVTMRDLLTHSGGFEDVGKGLIVSDPSRNASLRQALVSDLPTRIFPPGTTPAYSNWGAALAGYIVQRVSGEAFPDYIAQHIFAPLGMAHSSFQQPLPLALAPDMAKGYMTASGPARPYEFVPAAPAGALAASGDDIGRWMIAQLQDGQYHGRRILDAKTAEEMHRPQFRPVPGVEAMAFGFYTEPGNGRRVIAHMGDTDLFHSDMHLFLDEGVGIFVSLNGNGKAGASYAIRTALYHGFLDRYFPVGAAGAQPTWPNAVADGRMLSGLYISTLRSGGSWRRLAEQLLGQVKVSADKDGVLTVGSMEGLAGEPIRWREVGPFQYRQIGGWERLGAKVVEGRPVLLQSDGFPPVEALQPVSPWLSASWNLPLFYATLVVLIAAVVTWPIGAFAGRRYRAPATRAGRSAALFTAARTACAVQLLFWLGCFVFLQKAGGEGDFLGPASDACVRGLQVLGWLCVVGALAAVLNAAEGLRDPTQRLWGRIAPVLIALACVATVWFGFSLSLIDGRLVY
jgi:CubicO group peptidase (beta-lactamase class C family)